MGPVSSTLEVSFASGAAARGVCLLPFFAWWCESKWLCRSIFNCRSIIDYIFVSPLLGDTPLSLVTRPIRRVSRTHLNASLSGGRTWKREPSRNCSWKKRGLPGGKKTLISISYIFFQFLFSKSVIVSLFGAIDMLLSLFYRQYFDFLRIFCIFFYFQKIPICK